MLKHLDLRLALRIDALASGAVGVLQLVAATLLHDWLGAPVTLLRVTGAFLVVFALLLWTIASRPAVDPRAAWSVVAANATWVVASVAVVAAGWFGLTGLGVAFVLMQAAIVVVFADLQVLGLRRMALR